jgi:4-hydroxyphenylpyruvate dioxygenase-like putative hemolysin
MLTDDTLDLLTLKELTWLLINMTCYSESQASAFFDAHCSLIQCLAQCVSNANARLTALKAELTNTLGQDALTSAKASTTSSLENQIVMNVKVVEQALWVMANLCNGSPEVSRAVVYDWKVIRLMSHTLRQLDTVNLEFMATLEMLLNMLTGYE